MRSDDAEATREATTQARRRWDRKARLYDLLTAPAERMMGLARGRGWVFERLPKGRVLEVGAGTGKNLSLHPARAVVVATDLSEGMLARAKQKAAGSSRNVRFVVTDAEHLAFRDGVFDAAVATCVFCSVPDPVRGLKEVRRVIQPGGSVILLEHMRPQGVLGRVFDLLDPIVSRLMGPHINRRTLENVRRAGLTPEEERNVFSDWVKVVVAHPPSSP
ncbi:MAG: methyltransferase domain-containing protein [candidate division NC10 bacterium]|nr:methyltransferase domain-containing protein [candidate division NC10 bacterium]